MTIVPAILCMYQLYFCSRTFVITIPLLRILFLQITPLNSTFFFYWFFFIGVQLLYNVVLVSVVQWSDSTICVHISPPSWTSLPFPTPPILVITEHRAELPVLYSRFLPSSVRFSHSVVSDSLWPHGLQHTKPPCSSPAPRVYSNFFCPLTQRCHPSSSSSGSY